MKSRSFILKCAAAFLLLVFVQKTGVSLIFHNLFHTTAKQDTSASKSSGKEVSFACSCIDDFLMPFTETDQVEISSPATMYVVPTGHYSFATPFQLVILSSLRGPPASIV